MSSKVLTKGRVAVITGAALGIGLAASKRCAAMGMNVCLADLAGADLDAAYMAVCKVAPAGAEAVLAQAADVSRPADLASLKDAVYGRFGETALLMNNAATRTGGKVMGSPDDWRRCMDVNFWGVVNGVDAFLPAMLVQPGPAMIVNTGSKQGITNPPGNAAYNVTKAALKSYTESLQHELRNMTGCRVSAHLLIPGFTTTGKREHKPGAWWPDQVIDVLFEALGRGDFYILCADNEVTPEMDASRMRWAAGDIIENRPPLSRWHPDFAEKFDG